MKIPQLRPWLGDEEAKAVSSVVKSEWITEGPKSSEFSEKLNGFMGTSYGVFAPNGTLALFLGLHALGIGPGDEVIVPDTTMIASATSVALTGATPVFAEVNDRNFQIDVASCEKLISPRTRAVMPVHLYGMCADMDGVTAFAKKHNLFVIEDACEAIGVEYKGKHAGTIGDVGCFSFFADKTITTGEGGYVVCRDKDLYEKLLFLRNQGRRDRGTFIHPEIGYNFRMTDLQTAVGLVQLGKLDEIIRRKTTILEWYQSRLGPVRQARFLEVEPGSTYVPFRVILLAERAHELMDFLAEKEIQPRTFFYPLHKQPCFANLDRKNGGGQDLDDRNFPNAMYGYEHGVSLPVYPTISEEEVKYVCEAVKEFYDRD